MSLSRRDWLGLMPALWISRAKAAEKSELPSKAYRFEELPVQTHGQNKFRPILDGRTHGGFRIEAHATDLAPGMLPHVGHRHQHEEMFLIREGTVEVMISGRSTRLGPGSLAYVASNEDHSIRNAGETHAQYFVIALGEN